MRKVSALILSLLAVSCTGMDKHASDTFYPLNNPNMPDAHSEVVQRIRGREMSTVPILPEQGDVWPGQPESVPSLQDVSRSNNRFYDRWRQARPGLDRDLAQQLGEGQGMTEGEGVGRRYGAGKEVMLIGRSLPSHVQDNALLYLGPIKRGVVTIPNGNGTVTLIAPDGTVKIASAGQAAFLRMAKTFHKARDFAGTRHKAGDVAQQGSDRLAAIHHGGQASRKFARMQYQRNMLAKAGSAARKQEEETARKIAHRMGRKVRHGAAVHREPESRSVHRAAAAHNKTVKAKVKAQKKHHRHHSQ